MRLRDDAYDLFVRESNKIEGIRRDPTEDEILAHARFFALPEVNPVDLVALVNVLQPGARLRLSGECVRVGRHVPPPGGPAIGQKLDTLLYGIKKQAYDPWRAHCEYETLHPFTDGNGRSGRALWAWQMLNQAKSERWMDLGFLHLFYYQTLDNVGRPERVFTQS